MTLRIAINGFGRIGRNVLRALYTQGYRRDLQIVAINDLGDSAINAHLLKFDTVHGTFDADVQHDHESLTVNGDRIRSEEHTSELQSLMRTSYAVFCLTKKKRYIRLSSHPRISEH